MFLQKLHELRYIGSDQVELTHNAESDPGSDLVLPYHSKVRA